MALTCRYTTTLHLPPELWCEIFEDVDPDTLRSVSLTCRHFYSITRPLIFRDFLLHQGKDQSQLDILARLDFFKSDAIAPHVRGLGISAGDNIQQSDSMGVLTAFFSALPRFLNARSLGCLTSGLTAPFLQQVSKLPSLEDLIVFECPPHLPADSLPMLRLRTFMFFYYPGRGTELLGAHRWLALLDPDYLQVLHIPLTSGTCSFFLASDNLSPHPFPSLHTITLKCKGDFGALRQLLTLLFKIPALCRLTLFLGHFSSTDAQLCIRTIEALEAPHICPLPFLEQYTGPHELLPVLLYRAVESSSTHLRRLVLESIPKTRNPLDANMNALKLCPPLHVKDLTHLRFSLPKLMDFRSLTALQDMFPVLQELDIRACTSRYLGGSRHDILLNDLYSIQLPRSVVSLSIQWMSVNATMDLPSLITAKDSLLPQLPSLRRLWLCDWSKLALLWSRTTSGTEERCNHFEVGSSARNDNAWKMRVVVFPEETFCPV